MSADPRSLAQRREQLRAQAAAQRQALAQAFGAWHRPLHYLDRARAAAHYLRQYPLLWGSIVLLLLWRRPRGALKWAQRAWIARDVARALRPRR
jgi:YqjK-like protein